VTDVCYVNSKGGCVLVAGDRNKFFKTCFGPHKPCDAGSFVLVCKDFLKYRVSRKFIINHDFLASNARDLHLCLTVVSCDFVTSDRFLDTACNRP
jgi:hypothetical protein